MPFPFFQPTSQSEADMLAEDLAMRPRATYRRKSEHALQRAAVTFTWTRLTPRIWRLEEHPFRVVRRTGSKVWNAERLETATLTTRFWLPLRGAPRKPYGRRSERRWFSASSAREAVEVLVRSGGIATLDAEREAANARQIAAIAKLVTPDQGPK